MRKIAANERGEEYLGGGRYRKAAVWEFVGHTFEKGDRMPGKGTHKKRFKHYAAGFFKTLEPTNLRYVMTVEEEEKEDVDIAGMEVVQEWDFIVNGGILIRGH
jgi:hypothetical protein